MTAVINIMPLIQFMALIQCNVTLDINYASKQMTCAYYTVSWFAFRAPTVLFIIIFWQYGCDPW